MCEGQNFATAPVLPGRMVLTPYRSSLLNDIYLLQQQLTDKENEFLGPAPEDVALYASFLELPQTGLTRLLPRETYDPYWNPSGGFPITGGGAYYSFAKLTHVYGYGSDIEQGSLTVGFAGYDFGFLTSLGNVAIE